MRTISISANDAFAGPSFLPYFHAEFAKLWAIQYQKPVIRSANAGISMILNHHGEVISKLDLFKQGILVNQVIINSQNNSTPKHHWVIWISLMISGLTLIYFLFNKIGIIPINVVQVIFLYDKGSDDKIAETSASGKNGTNFRNNKYIVSFSKNPTSAELFEIPFDSKNGNPINECNCSRVPVTTLLARYPESKALTMVLSLGISSFG